MRALTSKGQQKFVANFSGLFYVPQGSSLPNNANIGDLFLLTPNPIFRAQLNGSPSDSDTTLTVDNVTVGAETDTNLGLFLFNDDRVLKPGQIDAQGSTGTLNVLAHDWATEGWVDDDWVEVRAPDSVWIYTREGWKCEFISYTEWVWEEDKTTTSTSFAAIGEKLYFNCPTECDVKFEVSITMYKNDDNWYVGAVALDGGAVQTLGGGWNESNIRGGSHLNNFLTFKNVAAGSHYVEFYWRVNYGGTVYSYPVGSSDRYDRKTSVLLRRQ